MLPLEHEFPIAPRIGISPDGARVAIGNAEGRIEIWNARHGTLLTSWNAHPGYVTSVVFHPGGQWLASAGADGNIRLWETATGAEMFAVPGHSGFVSSIAFSPDGHTLISGGSDNRLKLWDVKTGQELSSDTFFHSQYHADAIPVVAVSPDGTLMASGGRGQADTTIRIWNLADQHTMHVFKSNAGPVEDLAFNSDHSMLLSGHYDGAILLWNIETGELVKTIANGGTGYPEEGNMVYSLAFRPDNRVFASAHGDTGITLWDSETGAILTRLQAHTAPVYSVMWNATGRYLVSGSYDGTLALWDMPIDETLLQRSCERLQGYLRHNPHVDDQERGLCDHIMRADVRTGPEVGL